jgi:hypothetical protein
MKGKYKNVTKIDDMGSKQSIKRKKHPYRMPFRKESEQEKKIVLKLLTKELLLGSGKLFVGQYARFVHISQFLQLGCDILGGCRCGCCRCRSHGFGCSLLFCLFYRCLLLGLRRSLLLGLVLTHFHSRYEH